MNGHKSEGVAPQEVKKYPNDRIPVAEDYGRTYSNEELQALGPVFAAHIYAEIIKKTNGACEPEPIRTHLHRVFGGPYEVYMNIATDAYLAHR